MTTLYVVTYQPLVIGQATYYTVGPFGSQKEAGKYAKANYPMTKDSHKWIVNPITFPER